MKNYELWLNNFMESWKNLEGIKIQNCSLKMWNITKPPMGEPCKTWEEVEDLWRVVNYNQKVQLYSFEILCETKDFAIVNWQMERTMNGNPQKIDGIFQISLNDENKLTYFKQWRAVL